MNKAGHRRESRKEVVRLSPANVQPLLHACRRRRRGRGRGRACTYNPMRECENVIIPFETIKHLNVSSKYYFTS